jgi:hypothetical protein
MVSESLRNLLGGEMSLVPEVPITLLAPDDSGPTRRINLFLYKTSINPGLRNLDWQLKPGDSTRLVAPPLSINLGYMMTAIAPNDAVTGQSTAQELMGEAMRVFHQFPVVPLTYLPDGLKTAHENVRLIPEELNLQDMGALWTTFSQPYRLTVVYSVSVVQIDPSTQSERALPARVRHVGVPDVRAPFVPPDLASIAPLAGPAGSSLTVVGTSLDGWRAYASITGRTIADALAIVGDAFSLTLPGDLAPGFHELRIDVSHILRKTFFFEVTP